VDSFISKVFTRLCRRIEHDDIYQHDLNRITELKKTGADEFTSSMLTEEYTLLHRYFKISTHYKLDLLKKYFRNYYQLEAPGHNASFQELNDYTRQLQSNKSSLEGAHSSVLSMLESRIETCEQKYLSDLSSRFCSLVSKYFSEKAARMRICNNLKIPARNFIDKYSSRKGARRTVQQKKTYEQATLSNIKQEKFTRDSVLSEKKFDSKPNSAQFGKSDESFFDPNRRNGQGTEFSRDELDLDVEGRERAGRKENSDQDVDRYDRLAEDLMNGNGFETGDSGQKGGEAGTGTGGKEQSGEKEESRDPAGSGQPGSSPAEEARSGGEQSESSANVRDEGSGLEDGVRNSRSPCSENGGSSGESEMQGEGESSGDPGESGNSGVTGGDGAESMQDGGADGSDNGSADDDIPVIDLTKFMSALNDFSADGGFISEFGGTGVDKVQNAPDNASGLGKYAVGEAEEGSAADGDGSEGTSIEQMLKDMGIETGGSYDEDGVYDPHPENFWTHQYWQLGKWKDADQQESAGEEEEPSEFASEMDPQEKYARDVDNYFNDLVDELLSGKGSRFVGPGVSDGFLTRDDRSDYIHYFSIVENNTGLQKLLAILGKQMGLDRSNHNRIRMNDRSSDRVPHRNPESMSGITMGNEISYVLPEELVKISDQDTEAIFDICYIESNLLRFDLDGIVGISHGGRERIKSSPRRGRGPVVLCVDTSSSMQGVPESYAKAMVMSLALKCHDARRDCFVINFSVRIEKLLIRDDDEDAEEKLLDFLNKSFNGGSDLDEALQECLQLMRNDPRFYRSDVLCITDGQINYSPQLAELVRRRRQHEHNRFYELVIGSMANESYWLGATESIRSQSALFDHLFELSTDGRWMREVKI
jgi:uncharacterized protein with von Willebrand factor type A (vWA) domain